MKKDVILSSVINFLLPIIFLYSLFFLVGFFEQGFFVFIYFLLLAIISFVIFYTFYSEQNLFKKIKFSDAILFLVLTSFVYIFSLLIFITDNFLL
ncbi:MAG TPA: hypothetical protein VI861_03395 [Rickettsiales bacterium]|nr:hypothetical protein [Rickettsiales bacterium]